MKYFSNETLNFFFGKFLVSYILDLAKTPRALRILSYSFNIETLNSGTNLPLQTLFIKEHLNKTDTEKVG